MTAVSILRPPDPRSTGIAHPNCARRRLFIITPPFIVFGTTSKTALVSLREGELPLEEPTSSQWPVKSGSATASEFTFVKSRVAAARVQTACPQSTSFGLPTELGTGMEVRPPSLGATSHQQRAFPKSGWKRSHVWVLAAASSTLAVLQSKPVCAMAAPTGCVLIAPQEVSLKLPRPWSVAERLCSRAQVSTAGCHAGKHLARHAAERLDLGSALAWAAQYLRSCLCPTLGLCLPGGLWCLSFYALGTLDMGRPLGSARSGWFAVCTCQTGHALRDNSARTIDAGGRSCVGMPI